MTHREAIANLMGRYTQAYDLDRLGEMKACFTDDAVMTMQIADGDQIGRFEGSDAIVQMMTEAHQGQDDVRRHVITNVVVDDVSDTSARAVSYLTLLTISDGKVNLLTTGRYEDELVRTDDQWLFRKRHIALDLPF